MLLVLRPSVRVRTCDMRCIVCVWERGREWGPARGRGRWVIESKVIKVIFTWWIILEHCPKATGWRQALCVTVNPLGWMNLWPFSRLSHQRLSKIQPYIYKNVFFPVHLWLCVALWMKSVYSTDNHRSPLANLCWHVIYRVRPYLCKP